MSQDKAITLGHPSYVWRAGQERRLQLMQEHVSLTNQHILDVGCGVGMYVHAFLAFSPHVYGVDIDLERAREAGTRGTEARETEARGSTISVAPAERLPFRDAAFDVVLLHEVIEHVQDDAQALAEACRVTRPGGHVIIFCPNRRYFFETHGAYVGSRYVFGLIPLVNWLPDRLRRRFCPHVRAYTPRDIRRLLAPLPCRIQTLTQIYPGYDNIAARHRHLADLIRRITYTLEQTPLRAWGLSHLVVVQKQV
ncbi:MAG: class I SAM-dependent methyltransferase [Chloroflexi bacterium]|nr:class I SAM-dependent methyltransferase [Chloroflexota bacterium]MBU1751773.1 class I SAM-dependent methyltransferase [Chloroflexota bacterium]MBU1879826.1 class I SAM-dependent methyltransferase [Chloroflexota bacterium]